MVHALFAFRPYAALTFLVLALGACDTTPQQSMPLHGKVGPFPAADRPVAHIVSSRWSTEEARDRLGEAGQVMDKAGVRSGMTVADIGAGEGYYTIRLARRVGDQGRVLAEDIDMRVRNTLMERVAHAGLDNVSVRLGKPGDPNLPPGSIDRIFLVHMYHEIEQPYEFLWRVRPSLRPDGEIVVVDANRSTQDHGTPPALLRCEFARVGYTQVAIADMPSAGGYLATFHPAGRRPDPAAIRPCRFP